MTGSYWLKAKSSGSTKSLSNLTCLLHSIHGWCCTYLMGLNVWVYYMSIKLITKIKDVMLYPSWSATLRASITSETEQHPVSEVPPHNFIVTPTTSYPCSEAQCCYGKVNTSRHCDENFLLAFHDPKLRSLCIAFGSISSTLSTSFCVLLYRDNRNEPLEVHVDNPLQTKREMVPVRHLA